MANIRAFQAKDGSDWLAFPHEAVQVMDDPNADDADPIVLVLDRKRAGALAVMALAHRSIMGTLSDLVESMGEVVGRDQNAVSFTRQLGSDLATALEWDVADDHHKLVEKR